MNSSKLLILTLTLFLSSCVDPKNTDNKSGVVISMAKSVALKNNDIKHMQATELLKRRENKIDDLIIVDVRTKAEQMESMIPGAISKELFEKHAKYFKDKDIVSYCTVGSRSSEYTRELQKNGYKAYSLQGGILSWIHRGGKVFKEDKEVKKVRFLSEAWNLLPKGYEGVFP